MLIIQTYFNKTLSEFSLIKSLLPNPVIFENFLYRWLLDYWVSKGRLGMEFILDMGWRVQDFHENKKPPLKIVY